MDIHEFIEEHQSAASKYIKRYFTPITSEQLGIDKRAGSCLYITEDAIAIPIANVSVFDYYSGFDDVSKRSRYATGGFVFYIRDDKRVSDCIAYWKGQVQVDNDLVIA